MSRKTQKEPAGKAIRPHMGPKGEDGMGNPLEKGVKGMKQWGKGLTLDGARGNKKKKTTVQQTPRISLTGTNRKRNPGDKKLDEHHRVGKRRVPGAGSHCKS